MEKELIDYLNLLRDFGRIYRDKIIDGNPRHKTDLKLSQIKTLYAFRDKDCLSMKELAFNSGVKLPTMTMMIDNLLDEEIAVRDRDADDRRKVIVRLTPKGKRIRSSFLAYRHKVAQSIFAGLDERDKAALLQSLGTVCSILEKAFSGHGVLRESAGEGHSSKERVQR